MDIKRYYADERGRVVINGYAFSVRYTEKFKNYRIASNNLKFTKIMLYAGGISVLVGLFMLFGLVGHVELASISVNDGINFWKSNTYLWVSCIGLFLVIFGAVSVNWSYPKVTVYERWIDEYLEQ